MNINWGLLVVIYLFLAGMAGGVYFTAAMYDLFDHTKKEIIRKGYKIALWLQLIAVLFLIFDLEQPARFIHMMFTFKFFSPMSIGSWCLLLFGMTAFVTVAANSEGALKPLGSFFLKILPYKTILIVGTALSVFLAAYTGVLLGETTSTLWSATPFLGALFLASGISCGACLLLLLETDDPEFTRKGKLFDSLCLIVEIAIILFFVLALTIGYGPYPETKALFSGLYGVMFIGGGVVLGAIVPIIINVSGAKGKLAPALVLLGAFFLRYAIVFAGQQ
jgi:formate-dependent nitrite reductase membrane component NrfD